MILIGNLNVPGGRDPLGRDNYFYLRELCLERIDYFKANWITLIKQVIPLTINIQSLSSEKNQQHFK